jgi:Tfp pilus assembly protein FimT
MPISSVGNRSNGFRAGVTLVEMMLVVGIVALIVGISLPAVTAGLESIRLRSATDGVASFLNGALNRAERRQEPVELIISAKDNMIALRSADGSIYRRFDLTGGVFIQDIQPGSPEINEQPRHFVVLPGGTPPGVSIELANRRGQVRRVRVDPITGAPEIQQVGQ